MLLKRGAPLVTRLTGRLICPESYRDTIHRVADPTDRVAPEQQNDILVPQLSLHHITTCPRAYWAKAGQQ